MIRSTLTLAAVCCVVVPVASGTLAYGLRWTRLDTAVRSSSFAWNRVLKDSAFPRIGPFWSCWVTGRVEGRPRNPGPDRALIAFDTRTFVYVGVGYVHTVRRYVQNNPDTEFILFVEGRKAVLVLDRIQLEIFGRTAKVEAIADKLQAFGWRGHREEGGRSELRAALFARACVLVAGPTEVTAIPELLRRLGTDTVRLGIPIVPVEGVTNIAKWVRYFKAHSISVYPILDTESRKTGRDPEKAESARPDIWSALSLQTEYDWNDYETGPILVTEKFAAMDPDYEGALRQIFGDTYASLEANARTVVGDSKSLVARYVARKLPVPTTNSEWDKLRPLAEQIAGLTSTD